MPTLHDKEHFLVPEPTERLLGATRVGQHGEVGAVLV